MWTHVVCVWIMHHHICVWSILDCQVLKYIYLWRESIRASEISIISSQFTNYMLLALNSCTQDAIYLSCNIWPCKHHIKPANYTPLQIENLWIHQHIVMVNESKVYPQERFRKDIAASLQSKKKKKKNLIRAVKVDKLLTLVTGLWGADAFIQLQWQWLIVSQAFYRLRCILILNCMQWSLLWMFKLMASQSNSRHLWLHGCYFWNSCMYRTYSPLDNSFYPKYLQPNINQTFTV